MTLAEDRPTATGVEPVALTVRNAAGVVLLHLTLRGAHLLAPTCDPRLAADLARWREHGVTWLEPDGDGWLRHRARVGQAGFLSGVAREAGGRWPGCTVEVV